MSKRPLVMAVSGIVSVAVVFQSSTAQADSITLQNGDVLTGIVKQVESGYEITTPSGGRRFVAATDVRRIKLDNAGQVDESTARERLNSLRRSFDAERDPARAIERAEQFIEMNAGTAAATEAKKDVEIWRERRDKQMLKIGKEWMTAADRDRLLGDIAGRVDRIRGLLAAGEFDQANALLRDATQLDPTNISFNYLAGVLQFRRGQFAEAKRSFDLVAEQVPDHPPTLLNQAILLTHFKRWPQAAQSLEQAIQAAPGNRQLLDNVLEFLQLVPEGLRKSLAIERLVKTYVPQEEALAAEMANRGLFRLGSKWVDQAALDAVKKEIEAREIEKKKMESEFSELQQTIRRLDEDIARSERFLQQMERDRYVRDSTTGKVYERPYPDSYWDTQRDLSNLVSKRKEEASKVTDLRKKAADFEKQKPASPFTGTLTLIAEEGVPVMLPAASSQPASVTPSPSTKAADATTRPLLPPPGAPYQGGPFAPPEE